MHTSKLQFHLVEEFRVERRVWVVSDLLQMALQLFKASNGDLCFLHLGEVGVDILGAYSRQNIRLQAQGRGPEFATTLAPALSYRRQCLCLYPAILSENEKLLTKLLEVSNPGRYRRYNHCSKNVLPWRSGRRGLWQRGP